MKPTGLALGQACGRDEDCYNNFKCCAGACCRESNCLGQAKGNEIEEVCIGANIMF